MKIPDQKTLALYDPFGIGAPNEAYARYFTGASFLKPLTAPGESPVSLANVTFSPGCRNHWHIHHAARGGGQMLLCTAGTGWYQEAGRAAVPLTPGAVITVPPGVKHWHGAAADSYMSHIALEVPGEGLRTEWCEAVTEAEYALLKS